MWFMLVWLFIKFWGIVVVEMIWYWDMGWWLVYVFVICDGSCKFFE